ncbi:MAG: exosortase/archaeosortase family protein [Anaerolineales bacterium]
MDNLTLIEAGEVEDSRKPIIRLVLIMAAVLIMVLPFVTTFNEFLTRVVETTGLDMLLTDWVVPVEARMLAVILGFLGIPSQVSATTIYLDKGGFFLPVYISWNCVGWQSFILFAVTLATGIQGPFSRASKFEAVVIGFLGTFLVNLLRIASVAVVAFYFGQMPALVYHDYGGTIIILLWLFAYWWFSHGWLLEPLEELPDTGVQEPFLRDVYARRAERQPLWARLTSWRK